MLCLGAWISKLSVKLVFTINMGESSNAHNHRHSRRAVSGTQDENSMGEALGQGIGSSKCGSRTPPAHVEIGRAHHSAFRSVEVAGKT